MTRNHMALSIDDNDDLKENQQLQLQSHYNHNTITITLMCISTSLTSMGQ